jgi:histidine ammonia-lyase
MSMSAALKAERALHLATNVIAVEVVCACQAIDLLAPLTSTEVLMRVHHAVRERVPALVSDRPPAPDIEAIAAMIRDGALEYASASVVN